MGNVQELLHEAAGQVVQAFLVQLHQHLGHRLTIDGGWYWDLKPDYRCGDVIER